MFSVAGGAALGDTQAIREREAIRYKPDDNERVIARLICDAVWQGPTRSGQLIID